MSRTKNKTSLPDNEQHFFKVIETPDQRASLYDMVRQEMIKVLNEGYEDYTSEIKREQRTLDDGTRITEEVKVEKPVRRFWMTVPEILETLRINNPSLSLATTKAYYHLGKLHEQGFLEQFPETASETKTRVRGRYFRTSAQFFVEVTVEASVGYSGTAVMPEEIGPRFAELALGVRDTGVAASMEYQVNLDGVLLWVSMTMSRHTDGQNIIAVVRDITTHRTLEERLERSEIEFGRLVEESFQGYAIFQDGIPVFVNPAYANTVGRPRSEITSMSSEEAWKMIHPEDRPILEERNTAISVGEEILPQIRFQHIRPDGTLRWVESFGRKTEHLGRPALLVLEIDITEQIEAELELQKSEQRNRIVADTMSDLVLVFDSENKYREYYGDSSLLVEPLDEMEVKKQGDQIPKVPTKIREEYARKVRKTGESITYEFELEIRGNVRWLQSTMMLHEDKESIVVAVKDISERKTAEESVKRSERRFREIFESSPVAIGRCNIEGTIVEMNQDYLNLFGVSSLEDGSGYQLGDDPHVPKWALAQAAAGDIVTFDVTYDFDLIRKRELYNTSKTGRAELVATLAPLNLPENDPEAGYLIMVQDVTERLRAEEALRDSEERYRGFFEQAGDAIIISDPLTSEIIDFNRQAYESLGYTEDEFRKLKLWEIDVIQDKTEVEARFMEIAEKGNLVYETKHETKSGAIRDVRISSMMMSFRDRMVNQAIITDITDQKHSQEALGRSEERYRTLVESSMQPITITTGPPPRIVFMNKSTEDLLGVTLEELQTKSDEEEAALYGEEGWKRVNERFNLIMDETFEPDPAGYENRIERPDGEIRWVQTHPSRIIYEGKPAVQSVSIDTTEQKKMFEELRASEGRYRLLFDTTVDAVVLWKDAKVIDANPAAVKIFGFEIDNLIGKTPWNLSPRKQPDGVLSKESAMEIIERLFRGEPQLFHWRHRRKDGTDFDAFIGISVVNNDERIFQSVIRLDITEHFQLLGG